MRQVRKSALLPYSAEEMYNLVADIETYPQFLSWCSAARVIAREGNVLTAKLDIHYASLHKSFTTRNHAVPVEKMEMRLVEGPFKHLLGCWRFQALDDHSCKVSLEMDFTFANGMLDMLVGPVFSGIVNSQVESFRQRAVALYGKR